MVLVSCGGNSEAGSPLRLTTRDVRSSLSLISSGTNPSNGSGVEQAGRGAGDLGVRKGVRGRGA